MAIVLLPLTRRQEEILGFMWGFYQGNDQLPPRQVMADHFKWTSKNAATSVLGSLESKGYIERNAVEKYRFTALFHAEQQRLALAEEGA